jgi:hypothetical protein
MTMTSTAAVVLLLLLTNPSQGFRKQTQSTPRLLVSELEVVLEFPSSSFFSRLAFFTDTSVWAVRTTSFDTAVNGEGGMVNVEQRIGTVANCIPVVRRHAGVGDTLLIFNSTALSGSSEHRNGLLFVGTVAAKMSVVDFNGSEGGERRDSGIHIFKNAAALQRAERKLVPSEAEWSGKGGATDYHKPTFAPYDPEAKKVVDGEFVLFFHMFKVFPRHGHFDEDLSGLAPPGRGA